MSDLAFDLPSRPYPGMRPFRPEEWAIFYGRESMVDELVARLVRQRVVFVHGDSGCGKSSLIYAGAFARLEQGQLGQPWQTAAALPRAAPLWNIAVALARLAGQEGDEDALLAWRRALNAGDETPAAIGSLLEQADPGPRCLLIDQFEELFQHARLYGPEEAQILVRALVALGERPVPGLYLMMTMRSEFLGACARFEGFAEFVNTTQYLLPRMDHDDMLRAIREPAVLYDGHVSHDLAARLIADSGGRQDQLPLIQHALMQLYLEQAHDDTDGWRLGVNDFPASGGVAGMLSDHGDQVAAKVAAQLDKEIGRPLIRKVFQALTEISPDGHAIRRPRTFAELARVSGVEQAALKIALDEFRADGVSFLSPYPEVNLDQETLIDIGHEALIRCWRALAEPGRGWLASEFHDGLQWRALLVQAESFERDASNVIAPALAEEHVEWLAQRNPAWAERYGGGWARIEALVDASVKAGQVAHEKEAESLRREGRARVMRRGIVILTLMLGFSGWNYWKANKELKESRVQFERSQTLNSDLETAEDRSDDLERQLEETQLTLERAQRELRRVGEASSEGYGEITRQIESNTIKLATPTDEADLPVGPRIYIHIIEESQEDAVRWLQYRIEQSKDTRRNLTVPDIEMVSVAPSQAQLRCFNEKECAGLAPQILKTVNRMLVAPQLELVDLSSRYGNSDKIRPDHYEVWFPRGKIQIVPYGKGQVE
jgi:hypothetical protein